MYPIDCSLKRKYLSLTSKNVRLDEDISWLIGFYFAEGTKSKNLIGFANSDLPLVNKALRIFTFIGLGYKDWRCYIHTNNLDETSIKRFNEHYPGIRVDLSYSKLATKETLDFRINSRALSLFVNDYFYQCMQKILLDKSLSRSFLQGYSVGDGCIVLRNKQIHSFVITIKKREYLDYLVTICTLLYGKNPNIRMTKECYELSYCNVNIITKIILDNIFIDLDRQWSKLIRGYRNKQYTRSRVKYWDKIEVQPLDVLKIAELSGNSHWSVRDAMNRDVSLGLVKSEYKHINNRFHSCKCYSLTEEGRALLSLIKEVK